MNLMDKMMEKLSKLSLPSAILIASIVLGGFFYASQVNKQKSIERQQWLKLQYDQNAEEAKAGQRQIELQAKTEQDKKEYAAKRTKDCYNYEISEREKFSNVDSSFYNFISDECRVQYKNEKWKEGDPNNCSLFEKIIDKETGRMINKDSTCIEQYFSKKF